MKWIVVCVALVSCPLELAYAQRGSARESDLARRAAAILAERCVRCHGGQAEKGGLDLRTRAGLLRGGDSGPVIEPGRPEASELVRVVSGPKPRMPKGAPKLDPAEAGVLREWVAAEAPWPEGLVLSDPKAGASAWWSLEPLSRPAVPRPRNGLSVRNPIDAFVLVKLEEKGIEPSPEAERRTLIRRLTQDLHGLPPTPAEIADFLGDASPRAYERLVDRLLGSPRYGERRARHWLDVVHYADTHGYDKDKRRDNAWRYRDYVIRSFNADKPYARFIKEQIAGDVLWPEDPEAVVATGFIAAGPWDFVGHVELREGTVDKLKTRLIDRDDMVANTINTFNSMTVHCARCHDHKFDPIPQRDYYRLQAVFSGVERGDREYPDAGVSARAREIAAARSGAVGELAALDRAAASPEAIEAEATIRRLGAELAGLALVGAPSPSNGWHSAIAPEAHSTKWVRIDLGKTAAIDEIRLVPARPRDFADTPGFGFPVRFKVEVSSESDFRDSRVVCDETLADVPNPGDAPYVIRPTGVSGRYIQVSALELWKRLDDYVFALGEVEVFSSGENLAAGAKVSALDSIESGLWSARYLTDGADSQRRRDTPETAAIASRRAELSFRRRQEVIRRDARVPAPLREQKRSLARRIDDLDAELGRLRLPKTYAVVSHAPRPIPILDRGDVEQPRESVGPGALSCVQGLESVFPESGAEGERRARLANWIADPKNVLTWRSMANRVWQCRFGKGIVDTPSDFGRNGSKPSHPELLDWLACELRDNGGSLKALDRLIVTSSAYRRRSLGDPAQGEIDSDNRLLGRQNRRRLDAEAVRDTVLAVSGSLDPAMGGPGFELFRYKDDHSPIYDHDAPEKIDPPEARRRTIYRFIVRSVPNPFLECFDGVDPNTPVPVRSETISALQALALLNDPFMLAQAKAFAARLEAETADPRRRIRLAYEYALGRPPTEHELASVGAYAEKRSLASACRLLFNLNEFLFVD